MAAPWTRGLLAAAALGLSVVASAQDAPPLHTNEALIGEAMRSDALDLGDPLAVFAFVLGRLPPRVNVLPTENYYYFRFTLRGVPYGGNIRLAASDRDQGKVHFAYHEVPTDWHPEVEVHHTVLDASRGVTVERLAPLVYRVAHGDRSVAFALNDLSAVRPPPGMLQADEVFIGPVFDESAIRFFLVFNARLKVFHYILDETAGVADGFFAHKATGRLTIGKRTGFAFYRDDAGRRILIGVHARNSELNTYLDGPFDQLPDNFIEGDTLRRAIETVSPETRGQIDRFGNFREGGERFLIHPYRLYREPGELEVFHRCATSRRVVASDRARCFVMADEDVGRRNALPLALKKRR